MKPIRVAVLGAGPAGLSTALAVARAGHRVILLDRDPMEVTSGEDAFRWPRKGVTHFLQPHAFNPRGRREMRIHLPDVYASVLEAGAEELDLRPRLSGPSRPGDEDLVYLGVRRPLIEWALRKSVRAQPEIELLTDTRVLGLLGDSRCVEGARTARGDLRADLVVDALGRTSPAPAWLSEIGLSPPALESSDCEVLYYTRYYRHGCRRPRHLPGARSPARLPRSHGGPRRRRRPPAADGDSLRRAPRVATSSRRTLPRRAARPPSGRALTRSPGPGS